MNKIKNFKDFNILLESSEFTTQQTGTIENGVNNPSLSVGGFDKHMNKIQQGMSVLNAIASHISPSIDGLKGKIALNEQDVTNVTIIRIVQRNTIIYDVYIKFVINNIEYWGVANDITTNNTSITSEVFNDKSLIQTREWIIRTKGFLIKSIKKWLNPNQGIYKLVGEPISTINITSGDYVTIPTGSEIEVLRSAENKILISVDNERYTLINKNFIYFNWWFEPLN